MKTGRITPTREGVADRSRSDEVDRASPNHHDAERDRKPDQDEFVYRHGRLRLVLLASGLAALRRLAKRRHGTDLAEDVERVELVPVLDEAPVLDPPDVDRAHGKGIPGRGIAKETPCVRAHIAVATHHARAVRRAEDILGEHFEVGHARYDCAEDLLDPLRAGLGEGVVVHIAGREDLIEARYVVARYDLGVEMAKLDMIG